MFRSVVSGKTLEEKRRRLVSKVEINAGHTQIMIESIRCSNSKASEEVLHAVQKFGTRQTTKLRANQITYSSGGRSMYVFICGIPGIRTHCLYIVPVLHVLEF